MSALRFNKGKLLMSLVPTSLVRYTAAGLTYGAIKYEKDNWRKGFAYRDLLDSLKRHLSDFEDCKDFDEESGLPSLALIATNLSFLIEHWDKGLGQDDRVVVGPGRSLEFKMPKLASKDLTADELQKLLATGQPAPASPQAPHEEP
jgi:hypothetical protein